MSQTLYRHILRDAWTVTWRHPMLWLFGAFALFLGQSQLLYSLHGLLTVTRVGVDAAITSATVPQWHLTVFSPNSGIQLAAGIGMSLLMVLLLALFVFLVIACQGAVVAAGDHIFRKQQYSLSAIWHDALHHFWSITGVLVIKALGVFVVSALLLWLRYFVDVNPEVWWPQLLFVVGFAVVAIFDVWLTFSILFATCYVVLEKQPLFVAVQSGFALFRRHWLASLEIGILFLVFNMVVVTAAEILTQALFIPLFWFAHIMQLATGYVAPLVRVNLVTLYFFGWFLFAVYTTWFFMCVVVLFDHMQHNGPVSKVLRFLRGLVQREQ